jgi:hypothetical protein
LSEISGEIDVVTGTKELARTPTEIGVFSTIMAPVLLCIVCWRRGGRGGRWRKEVVKVCVDASVFSAVNVFVQMNVVVSQIGVRGRSGTSRQSGHPPPLRSCPRLCNVLAREGELPHRYSRGYPASRCSMGPALFLQELLDTTLTSKSRPKIETHSARAARKLDKITA